MQKLSEEKSEFACVNYFCYLCIKFVNYDNGTGESFSNPRRPCPACIAHHRVHVRAYSVQHDAHYHYYIADRAEW